LEEKHPADAELQRMLAETRPSVTPAKRLEPGSRRRPLIVALLPCLGSRGVGTADDPVVPDAGRRDVAGVVDPLQVREQQVAIDDP
jgi:hypothetical protein